MGYVVFAFTNPASTDMEDEYDAWYVKEHIPDVCRINGVSLLGRFRRRGPAPSEPSAPAHAYLTIYGLEDIEPAEFTNQLRQRSLSGHVRPARGLVSADPASAIHIFEGSLYSTTKEVAK